MRSSEPLGRALPIVQFWDSSEPPSQIGELIESFKRLNPERPHVLFDAESAEAFIARRFSIREVEAFRACRIPSMQADILRLCAGLELGGIWADAGLLCVADLDPLLDERHNGALFRRGTPVTDEILINSLFAFPTPQHPFLQLTLDIATALIEMRWEGMVNEVTGPLIMTVIYRLHLTGSVDLLLDKLRREFDGERSERFVPYTQTVCELIGDPGRAAEACRGVRIHEPDQLTRWAHHQNLPHRDTSFHWTSVGTSIYT